MDENTPGEHLSEEPQSDRGDMGSRDTGAEEPSGGPVDRPDGAIEGAESVPSMGDGGADPYGGPGTSPPRDTDPALPPYEGRQKHAKPEGEGGDQGGGNEGAAVPTSDS